MQHEWGSMMYCKRCGLALQVAVNRGFGECLAPPNMRSLANELAQRHDAWIAEKILSKWVDK